MAPEFSRIKTGTENFRECSQLFSEEMTTMGVKGDIDPNRLKSREQNGLVKVITGLRR